MGNYNTTKQEVKNYIFARVPLVIIHSSERERIEKMLWEIVQEMNVEIAYYTDAKQVCSVGTDITRDVESDPLLFAIDMFHRKKGATMVIGDARRLGDENAYTRELLNVVYAAMERAGTLILITPDTIWSRLARFGLMVKLDYPDDQERLEQIHAFIKRFEKRYHIEWEAEDCSRASALLRGFSEVQIENILSSTLVRKNGLSRQGIADMAGQKSRLYAAVPCVDEVKIKKNLEIAGMENLKDWLQKRRTLFFLSEDILEKYDLEPPKGILLAGVPGCGKSFAAKMVASEWELPLFRFDIGSIYDKWVGESERKMRDALEFIDNVAPCVVWIDEIEKALSVSDSGNDTGKRIIGQFLFWLQESASRVFLVATANDISQLPSEMFRKGRFSELFFADLPNEKERKETIKLYSRRCLEMEFSEEDLNLMIEASEKFSYSDIEYVIKEAAGKILLGECERVDKEILCELFQKTIPFSETNPEVVESIREWGKKRAVPVS